MRRSVQIQNAAAITILLTFASVLYTTSDRSGGFWWFDSASHAFNGVFLYDFFRNRGFWHPIEWALRYFDQYPAITLGFYPPGFAILLVPFYWAFGPNQAAAQAAYGKRVLCLGSWNATAGATMRMGFCDRIGGRRGARDIPRNVALGAPNSARGGCLRLDHMGMLLAVGLARSWRRQDTLWSNCSTCRCALRKADYYFYFSRSRVTTDCARWRPYFLAAGTAMGGRDFVDIDTAAHSYDHCVR